MHESCAVVGIYAQDMDISRIIFFALYTLQHRGQESSGIAVSDGRLIKKHSNSGLVSQVYTEYDLSNLQGHIGIGHNRYSTTGSSKPDNAQPLIIQQGDSMLALAHNGNIINAKALRDDLCRLGYDFYTTTDSEIIGKLILSLPENDIIDKIKHAMRQLQGAYSMALMTRDKLIAVRDPLGVRPLCLGKINGGWIIASESCALDQVGATFIRDIEPGEIIAIDNNGMTSFKQKSDRHAMCIFEYIYFARPDSIIEGKLVYETRRAMGAMLAREYPADADMVMGVPDSALPAAIGYAEYSGLQYVEGFIKNRYVGRTFIQPQQRLRDLGVRLKFNPLSHIINNKRLVVVDDSIVRGSTTPHIVELLRKAGAREVHLRICSPPICHPCFLGVDMASRLELIAARKTVPEIRDFLDADSLGYLSLDGLIKAIDMPKDMFCLSCFTGNYLMPTQMDMDKLMLEV